MINSIEITDNKNMPLSYASKLDSFKNGSKYEFKPGINIIIGKNGCGKTTLLEMAYFYALCRNSNISKIDSVSALSLNGMFNDDNTVKDGIKFHFDYQTTVYRYLIHNEMNKDKIYSSAEQFFSYATNTTNSTGQKNIKTLSDLFNFAFNNQDVNFPNESIKSLYKTSNDVWRDRLKNLSNYYKENYINTTYDDYEFTFLIDEPDRNLDIDNIDSIYSILSYHKEHTQLICVIHNPILIYKLSKIKDINFIEMSNGYLNKIKKVFNNIRIEKYER